MHGSGAPARGMATAATAPRSSTSKRAGRDKNGMVASLCLFPPRRQATNLAPLHSTPSIKAKIETGKAKAPHRHRPAASLKSSSLAAGCLAVLCALLAAGLGRRGVNARPQDTGQGHLPQVPSSR